MSLPMGKSRRCRLRESKRWQELEGKLWRSFKFAYKSQHHTLRIYYNREADKRKQRSSKTEMENAYRGGRDLKLTYKV